MIEKLNAAAFGASAACVAALVMVFLGIASRLGIYVEAAQMMSTWHLFFDTTSVGILAGTVEAAVITFALAFLFAALYNKIITLNRG